MRFLDANVVIDGLVDQGTTTHLRSRAMLDRLIGGQETFATTELVISEVIWTLRTARTGRLSRAQIAALLGRVIGSPYLTLANREVWIRTLEIYSQIAVDVPDAHLVATMEASGSDELLSYDSDFDRFSHIKRIVP